jgi:hypothetical protein
MFAFLFVVGGGVLILWLMVKGLDSVSGSSGAKLPADAKPIQPPSPEDIAEAKRRSDEAYFNDWRLKQGWPKNDPKKWNMKSYEHKESDKASKRKTKFNPYKRKVL